MFCASRATLARLIFIVLQSARYSLALFAQRTRFPISAHGIGFCVVLVRVELELELTQTQMTQKPMLRAELYAHAIHEVRREKEV